MPSDSEIREQRLNVLEGVTDEDESELRGYPEAYLTGAMEDYRAARILLLQQYPIPASSLAATAIEKSLKAIYYLTHPKPKRNFNHKILDLYKEVCIQEEKVSELVEEDFLTLLCDYYEYRYIEGKSDCDFTVCSYKLLLDLDESFLRLDRFIRKEYWGDAGATPFQMQTERRDEAISSWNVALGDCSEEELFAEGDCCVEWIFPSKESTVTHIKHTYFTPPNIC